MVKNKQGPSVPGAHTLIYGKGVPKAMSVLDMALDHDVVKRKGSWLAYKGETLGQGKESVSQYLAEHPELMDEITQDVLRTVVPGFELPEEKKDLVSDTVEGTGIPNESSEESFSSWSWRTKKPSPAGPSAALGDPGVFVGVPFIDGVTNL